MMATNQRTGFSGVRNGVAALLAIGALGVVSAPAAAQVPGVDLYVGVGIGQSDADIGDGLPDVDFDDKDTAWKVFGGVRAASMFGAELAYINFGKPDGDVSEVEYKGLAGFGVFYVPLPLPVVDIFAKAGLARVDVDIDAANISTDDTKFAYGIGAQLKLGSFALRGEYERFKVEGAKPSLLSLSFTKSFL
jgi:hypothetical protein